MKIKQTELQSKLQKNNESHFKVYKFTSSQV